MSHLFRTRYEWSERYSIIAAIFFILVVFIPVYRVAGIPLPLAAPFAIFAGVSSVLILVPREYIVSTAISVGFLALITAYNVYREPAVLSDMLYFGLPLIFLAILVATFTMFELSKWDITRVIRVLFLCQVGILLLQWLDNSVINLFLYPYLEFMEGNTTHLSNYLEFSESRPGGATINPTWVGFALYGFGRWLTSRTGRYWYVGLAFGATILSSGRMAMITIIVSEIALVLFSVYKHKDWQRVITRQTVAGATIGFVLIAMSFILHPFLNSYVEAAIAGNFQARLTNNLDHRIDMYLWLLSEPQHILVGGLTLSESPSAIDSELVMRTMQFSFLGYLAFKLPFMAVLYRGIVQKNQFLSEFGIVITVLIFLPSLTTTISSNMYFIQLFAFLIGAAEVSELPTETEDARSLSRVFS